MKKATIFIAVLLLMISSGVYAQDIETGVIGIMVSDYGRIRFYTPDTDGDKQLERASILVAETSTAVFDYKDDADTETDAYAVTSPTIGDYETIVVINNDYSEAPPEVKVEIHVYAWTNEKYFIVEYNITNEETSSKNYYIGLTVIGNPGAAAGNETLKYNSDKKMGYYFRSGESNYIGTRLLSHEASSLKMVDWDDYTYSDEFRYGLTTYTDFDTSLTVGENGSAYNHNAGAYTLEAGESIKLTYAYCYGTSETDLFSVLDDAVAKYEDIISSVTDNETAATPENFKLYQNYPNPFNPNTKIAFDMPKKDKVSLSVYNLLGQKVVDIFHGDLNAGHHSFDFNAENLSSGVYIYRIRVGNEIYNGKMTLVK